MNPNQAELILVLDASGSMEPRREETIHAVAAFIKDQKAQPGTGKLTVVMFADEVQPFYVGLPLEMAQPIAMEAYVPGGNTALLDAVGETIDCVGARLRSTPEADRPGRVVFMVITDGHENASTEFTKTQIRQKIEHQKTKYGWQFLFLGADPETFHEANRLGIHYAQTMSWEPVKGGIMRGMVATSNSVADYRNNVVGEVAYSSASRVENNSK
jgi:uncharacterized protein YegL